MGAFEYTALDTGGREKKGNSGRRHRLARCVSCCVKDSCCLSPSRKWRRKSPSSRRSPILREARFRLRPFLFTRQLATLVKAGLPLEESLLAVSQQTEKPRVQSIVLECGRA